MTDKVFNLQVKLIADDDRSRKQDRKIIEQLVGEVLKQVLPECIIIKLSFSKKE